MIRVESSAQWAARTVFDLPNRWRGGLLNQWEHNRRDHAGDHISEVDAERRANLELAALVRRLGVVRVPLDAGDSHICQEAEDVAARCKAVAMSTLAGSKPGPWALGYVFHTVAERAAYTTPAAQRAALERICAGYEVQPPKNRPGKSDHVEDTPAVKRMICPLWWRRQLRKVHAKNVEGAAIHLGLVNKAKDPYCSTESVNRRAGQNARNAATLESTIATNEDGQSYTLADLAATGPANKSIRRAELMTRIAGFERVAIGMGHICLFATLTAPSRMHKWTIAKDKGVFENRKFDGTTPAEAQKHHAKVWARTRASLKRRGVGVYGFRIAEPNHDGTPHWHMLFFMEASHLETFKATLMHYALQDSGTERGAAQHRCDFKPIEAGKGTAAGYIAKYVAKNIDGYALSTDLCGGEYLEHGSITTAMRVEAWASTWGIRQFQQIGGPPVGPWRELRRVEEMPADAPQCMVDAHEAVNKIEADEDGTAKPVAWDKYVQAQGGVFCGRAYAIRVTLQPPPDGDTSGRYGEPAAPKPIGVETVIRETWFPEWMRHTGGQATRLVEWLVASVRRAWTITRGSFDSIATAQPGPWTRFNNCTQQAHRKAPDSRPKGRETERGPDFVPTFAQ